MDTSPESSDEFNPFAAPQVAETAAAPEVNRAERIRREHIYHETSVRGAGSTYLLWGVLSMAVAVLVIAVGIAEGNLNDPLRRPMLIPWFPVPVASAVCIYVAILMRRLDPKARTHGVYAVAALTVYTIARFNVFNILGLLFNGYVVWLLLTRKGAMVLSDEYRAIMAETPHIVYRGSMMMVMAALLLVLLVAMVAVSALVSN